ncbi:MAG TPA: hypothetical protein VFH38_00025 [Jatrophihabitans sp.]|nr:hypothetical protein [Jatrophihabitans sp.]
MIANGAAALDRFSREALVELAPLLRRAQHLDTRALARLRVGGGRATALVRLPFGVLVARSVEHPPGAPLDVCVRAADALAFLDGGLEGLPAARDVEWRGGLPPQADWQAVESVPDDVIRPLVRSGAAALQQAAEQEGVPGAQPRAQVADALLDFTVLTVADDAGRQAQVSLRAVSALTRMGFLPRGGRARVDVAGRWVRLVAEYGTVYLERPGSGLLLR